MFFDKKDAIGQINNWGRNSTPFLFITDFELSKIVLIPGENVEESPISFQIAQNKECNDKVFKDWKPNLVSHCISLQEYERGFNIVMEHIKHGNSYLLNLTYPSEIQTDLTLDDIYCNSKARYKLLWKDKFTVFSPESFVRIKDNRIFSHPMKGTIDADLPNARKKLLDDAKELAEHYTIVDLIRNDINQVASDVKVNRFRYFDLIQTRNKKLYQTSSEISGQLPADWKQNLGNILFQLLPAGSVSGAPKPKTLEIIKDAEFGPRGYYTGVFGYFDGFKLDSGVMIRFIEQINGNLIYRSGGGITSRSVCEHEYEELKNKIYVPIV